jgi:hypothetical protein
MGRISREFQVGAVGPPGHGGKKHPAARGPEGRVPAQGEVVRLGGVRQPEAGLGVETQRRKIHASGVGQEQRLVVGQELAEK